MNDEEELKLIYIMNGHGYLTTDDLLSFEMDKTPEVDNEEFKVVN